MDPDGTRFDLLTLDDATAGATLYALIRSPGPIGAASTLQTILVLPDGDEGVSETTFLGGFNYSALAARSIQVAVAYRGETASFRGQTFRSTGVRAPYAADVRDVDGVLSAVRTVPRVDARKLALVGTGRGGTVAMLASARNPDVRLVGSYAAVTDLFLPSVKAEVRRVLIGQTSKDPLPGLDGVLAPVLALRSGEIGLDEARLRLLEASPIYTLPAVAPLVGAHGRRDLTVPVEHGERLLGAIGTLTPTRAVLLLEEGGHDVREDPEVGRLTVRFFQDTL